MLQKIAVTSLLFCLLASPIFSQKKFPANKEEKEKFDLAEQHFELLMYNIAVVEYEALLKNHPDEAILLFRAGQCQLYMPDGALKAYEYLSKLDYTQYYADNVEFYLARAYHLNSKFQESITMFEQFKANKFAEKELKDRVDMYVTYCKNGLELSKNPLKIQIDNLGAPINTFESEYAPNISADESELYFTYRGKNSMGGEQVSLDNPYSPVDSYYEDIYFSTKDVNGKWTAPSPLPPPINTEDNNACVALTTDGNRVFIYNSIPDGDIGSISESTRHGNEWEIPEELKGDVNSSAWEGDVSMSADWQRMIFASERPGGLGGSDLWSVELQADGTWGNLKNLGPDINTEFDEHSPFIHPSGAFLVFSSKGHNTIGGYDLFRSDLNENNNWSKPINMGVPLNTPMDDVFYTISADGKHGYYASAKPGGFGSQDIYIITPGIVGVKIIMAQVKGLITLNDQPVEADVKVTYTTTDTKQGTYPNNSATGKYLVDLAAGKEYTITYTIEGSEPQIRQLNTTSVKDFLDTTIDVHFYSPEFLLAQKQKEIDKQKEIELANAGKAGTYEFKQNFDYNKMDIKKADKEYSKFIDGVAEIIKINGKAYVDIEGSASKVPTTTYKTNENLSRLRSEKGKETILASLKAKGVDTSKVIFSEVNSIVKGPEFNDDHIENKKEYGNYQFVRVSAK
jgi:hypothetical protein